MPPAKGVQHSEGAGLIAMERLHQQEIGYDAKHDDDHTDGSLALAACAYAAPVPLFRRTREIHQGGQRYADCWPTSWHGQYDKRKYIGERPARAEEMVPATRIRLLVIAGAWIAAEIDRLLREQARAKR